MSWRWADDILALANGEQPPGADHELAQLAGAPVLALGQGRPHTSWARSGMKKMGSQPSATSAVNATFFSPKEATQIGISTTQGMGNDLERLAQTGASLGRQGQRVVLALVHERVLALPYVATDLNYLARSAQLVVVGNAVESLDDLGARRTQTQGEPTVGE